MVNSPAAPSASRTPSGPLHRENNGLKLGRHATNAQYFAGTIDDATGEMNLYVNGTLVGSTITETLPSDLGKTTQNWIGRSQWDDPSLNGAVDEFHIYNRALTPGGIQYLVGGR